MSHDSPAGGSTRADSGGSSLKFLVVGFPLFAVFGVVLTMVFRLFGYSFTRDELPISSVIAVVVGTSLLLRFRDRLATPSRLLLSLSCLSWLLILVLFLERHRLQDLIYSRP